MLRRGRHPVAGPFDQHRAGQMSQHGHGFGAHQDHDRAQSQSEAEDQPGNDRGQKHDVEQRDPPGQTRLNEQPGVVETQGRQDHERCQVAQILGDSIRQVRIQRVDAPQQLTAGVQIAQAQERQGQQQACHEDESVGFTRAFPAARIDIGELIDEVEAGAEEAESAVGQGEHGQLPGGIREAGQRRVLKLNRQHHGQAREGQRPVELPVDPHRALSRGYGR